MCPSLMEIGSKTAEKNPAQTNKQTNKQTNRQTDRHCENNGHLAVNLLITVYAQRILIQLLSEIEQCKCSSPFVHLVTPVRRHFISYAHFI